MSPFYSWGNWVTEKLGSGPENRIQVCLSPELATLPLLSTESKHSIDVHPFILPQSIPFSTNLMTAWRKYQLQVMDRDPERSHSAEWNKDNGLVLESPVCVGSAAQVRCVGVWHWALDNGLAVPLTQCPHSKWDIRLHYYKQRGKKGGGWNWFENLFILWIFMVPLLCAGPPLGIGYRDQSDAVLVLWPLSCIEHLLCAGLCYRCHPISTSGP